MAREIDALSSGALKHVRDRWWDVSFTEFLKDNLQPRPGKRILDVGCGMGTAELALGALHLEAVRLTGIDVVAARVREAKVTTAARGVDASFAVGDAVALPFADDAFDSTFCVAVLQHLRSPGQALAEFARVTRPGGRILAVEPDNRARYWWSSLEVGQRAFAQARSLFEAIVPARGEAGDPAIGPRLPGLFLEQGVEPVAVHLFPVSLSRLGAPVPSVWDARRLAIAEELDSVADDHVVRLGREYLTTLDRYAAEAMQAGPAFVEVQHTMLFAAIGQRTG
jgi:SAM-dependent methyltransferase